MATLPKNMIAEILSRLPVKSLLRLKSVCKSWYSLIKAPNLIKLHHNQSLISSSNVHLLLYNPFLYSAEVNFHDNHQLSFSKLHHPLDPQPVHLLGSCNGVICISDPSKSDVFLFNPLTNSRRKLPLIEVPDTNPNLVLFGFGYDSEKDDYKVLRMIQGFKVGSKLFYEEAKVCSLNDNSWKCVQGSIPFFLFDGYCHAVLVNEALHYIAVNKSSNSRGHDIGKFGLGTESFSLMAYPNYDDKVESNVVPTLMELGGCLSLMVNYRTGLILDHVDLWVMKEYGKKESWSRLFSISETESIGSQRQMKPIVYSRDGSKLLLEIDTLGFGWYDLQSKTVDRFTPHGLPESNIETSKFVGSLVSFQDKLPHSERGTLPKKNKTGVDDFLSTRFKLRL